VALIKGVRSDRLCNISSNLVTVSASSIRSVWFCLSATSAPEIVVLLYYDSGNVWRKLDVLYDDAKLVREGGSTGSLSRMYII
jgi:hypothetical protein